MCIRDRAMALPPGYSRLPQRKPGSNLGSIPGDNAVLFPLTGTHGHLINSEADCAPASGSQPDLRRPNRGPDRPRWCRSRWQLDGFLRRARAPQGARRDVYKRQLLERTREVLVAHPGIAAATMVDPPRTVVAMRLLEGLFGILLAGGLDPQDAAWAATFSWPR